MGNNAYVKLVSASKTTSITLQEVQTLLQKYIEISKRTGEQHSWDYENFSFPYEIQAPPNDVGSKLKLVSTQPRYGGLLFSVDEEELPSEVGNQYRIKASLHSDSTYGDKDRAIDYCKFIAKELQGELHLFNGRIMYFYKRK